MNKAIVTITTAYLTALSGMAHPGHSQHVHVTETVSLDLLATTVLIIGIVGTTYMMTKRKMKA